MSAVDRRHDAPSTSPLAGIAAMLHATAAQHGDRPAVLSTNRDLTWGELAEETARLMGGLLTLGVRPGDRVALVHGNGPEFVTTFLAVTALGAVLVPLNPQYQASELRYYFDHCDVRGVVSDPTRVAVCRQAIENAPRRRFLVTSGDASPGTTALASLLSAAPARDVAVSPDADAVYQYSSGSTGRPKRVPRTHEQCRWEADNCVETTALTADDRIFCVVPLFHTHGQGNCLLAAVRSGAALVVFDEPNPFVLKRGQILQTLSRRRATVFPGVPFVFRLLAEAPDQADLSSLRLCFSAGTALPADTFDAFRRRFGVPIRQLYGCTEGGALTINLDPDPVATAGSVGRPLARVRVRVVDDARRPLPPDTVGEVAISTPAMTRGYHDMPEHNQDAFRDGFFFTGDLGRLDAEGRLWLTGRKKLFIEVAGNKVDPVEVEDVLATHPGVREVVVVGVPGKTPGEETVKAVVVPNGTVDPKELVTLCQRRLARFKVPQLVVFRDEIPKSPLGKVLRKYLV